MLGPVEAVVRGHPVDIGPRRQRTVLARLLVDPGRPVPVERLLDDVWGGEPPPGALRTLRSYVSRLRAALGDQGDLLVARDPGYVLDVPPATVDAVRFEGLAAEGRALLERRNARAAAARLAEALRLWRGPPFAGLPDVPFAAAESVRLEAKRLAAVEDRIDADLAVGRAGDVVPEIEAALGEQPLRERLWGQLMTALYRCGRQAEALEAYQRARTFLRDELGLEPGPELRRLEASILRHELALAEPEPPHNLPAPLTSFVGREREVAAVGRLVDGARLVTLTGPGGAGKTRLALEVASRLMPAFSDGVWVVDLASVSDPALVAQTIAAAAGIEERSGRHVLVVLADHLAKARALLVLDNCEHLVAACAAVVAQLLSGAPSLHVVATSREPLAVPGETVFEVEPLDVPAGDAREDLERADAVRLFLERSAVAVDPDALPAVARICRELDGMPLAIEIAAAQTRLLRPDEIVARLNDRFRLLTYWSRTSLPRHRTLRASIDWSYALLDPRERSVLHQLSVFVGGFTLAAAEKVVAPAESALDAVRRLVDASLVQRVPGAGENRFRLLETVRQYARERAGEAGDLAGAQRRHAECFGDLADAALAAKLNSVQSSRHSEIDADYANVRAALEYAFAEADAGLVVRIVRGLGDYWRLRGFLDEGQLWLLRAVDLAGGAAPDVAADLHGYLGAIHLRTNEFVAAARRFEAAIGWARQDGHARPLAHWLHQLAYAHRAQGDLARARAVLGDALEISRAAGDRIGMAHRLGSLGDIAVHEGRLDDAEALFAEVWQLIQPATADHLVPYLESVARLALEQGDVDEGARRAEAGLHQARVAGDVWHVGFNLIALAYVARRRGESRRAGELVVEALDELWPIREVSAVAEALDVLGGIVLDAKGAEAAAAVFGAVDGLRARFRLPLDALMRSYVAADRSETASRVGGGHTSWTQMRSAEPSEVIAWARDVAMKTGYT